MTELLRPGETWKCPTGWYVEGVLRPDERPAIGPKEQQLRDELARQKQDKATAIADASRQLDSDVGEVLCRDVELSPSPESVNEQS